MIIGGMDSTCMRHRGLWSEVPAIIPTLFAPVLLNKIQVIIHYQARELIREYPRISQTIIDATSGMIAKKIATNLQNFSSITPNKFSCILETTAHLECPRTNPSP